MHKPMGTARDPFPPARRSSSPTTPGLGWVIAGFVAICIAVALAQNGWVEHSVALVAAASSLQG